MKGYMKDLLIKKEYLKETMLLLNYLNDRYKEVQKTKNHNQIRGLERLIDDVLNSTDK